MGRRNTGGGRRLPSPRKRKPIRRHPNPFVQSDIEDAERTLKWLRKEDMSRELQWIDKDKGIPTAWYAAEVLAKQNGIRCIHRDVHQGMDQAILFRRPFAHDWTRQAAQDTWRGFGMG